MQKLESAFQSGDASQWSSIFSKFQVDCASGAVKGNDARRGYELACLSDIKSNDLEAFQRHYSRVRQYTLDMKQAYSSKNAKQSIKVCAVHLMILLSEQMLADFHTELEILPRSILADPHIQFVLNVERWLMMGDYRKVLTAKPPEGFGSFLQRLYQTVREDIASCLEVTYTNISFEGAMKLLQLEDRVKLDEIIANREWKTHIENIYFKGDSMSDKLATDRISKLLDFTEQIEAIV